MSELPELRDITQVEERYTESGEPSLGKAHAMLVQRWRQGVRDRETALRLLFLTWFSMCEPPYLTGLVESTDSITFAEVFHALGGVNSSDPEVLFVLAYMCELFPYACGTDEEVWIERSRICGAELAKLGVSTLTPDVFRGRGAYGAYFAHIVGNSWR